MNNEILDEIYLTVVIIESAEHTSRQQNKDQMYNEIWNVEMAVYQSGCTGCYDGCTN